MAKNKSRKHRRFLIGSALHVAALFLTQKCQVSGSSAGASVHNSHQLSSELNETTVVNSIVPSFGYIITLCSTENRLAKKFTAEDGVSAPIIEGNSPLSSSVAILRGGGGGGGRDDSDAMQYDDDFRLIAAHIGRRSSSKSNRKQDQNRVPRGGGGRGNIRSKVPSVLFSNRRKSQDYEAPPHPLLSKTSQNQRLPRTPRKYLPESHLYDLKGGLRRPLRDRFRELRDLSSTSSQNINRSPIDSDLSYPPRKRSDYISTSTTTKTSPNYLHNYPNISQLWKRQQEQEGEMLENEEVEGNIAGDMQVQETDVPELPPEPSSLNTQIQEDKSNTFDEEEQVSSTSRISRRSTAEINPAVEDEADKRAGRRSNPVVYRYFGRSRARSIRSDSIPFIVLGPSVDHWKLAGRILASRGFNVMACESVRKKAESQGENDSSRYSKNEDDEDGTNLVISILEALKWNKAVLVGCDAEAITAIEAAMRLAPDRIAGLVLCGDLSGAEKRVEELFLKMNDSSIQAKDGPLFVDAFLRNHISCPCTIIWDGDLSALNSSGLDTKGASTVLTSEIMGDNHLRSTIVGGGSAPHRKLPEQFAWILTRFVEKQVSLQQRSSGRTLGYEVYGDDDEELEEWESGESEEDRNSETFLAERRMVQNGKLWEVILPQEVNEVLERIFSPGSLLVSGRVIACTIIYLSIARVSLFQYKKFRVGVAGIQSSYLSFSTWQKNVGRFLRRVGNVSGRTITLGLPSISANRHKRQRASSNVEFLEKEPESKGSVSDDSEDDQDEVLAESPPDETAQEKVQDEALIDDQGEKNIEDSDQPPSKKDNTKTEAPLRFLLDQVIS